MSLRCLQDMSSRDLQDVFSVTIFRLPRRLQDVLRHFCKASTRRLQDIFARRLQEDVLEDQQIVTLKTCWRRLQDVLKTNKCSLGYASNACWVNHSLANIWMTSLDFWQIIILKNFGCEKTDAVSKQYQKTWEMVIQTCLYSLEKWPLNST